MITCKFENNHQTSLRHVTVDLLLLKDNQILLGKRGYFNGKPLSEFGKWGLIGGYAERDENLAATARREAMEESGWTIANLQLFRINDNPNRPKEDRQNIDLIFIAQAIKQTGQSDSEVSELRWFNLSELPDEAEFAFDHRSSIDLYIKFLNQRFELPLLG